MDPLTKSELEGYLYMIRNTLCSYNYERLENVIFYNNDAVFEFLQDITVTDTDITVGEALDIIGAYIPISLNSTSLSFLMQSAVSPDQMEYLEEDFSKSNKMDFMQLLTSIGTQPEWNNLLKLCETIRQFRVNEDAAVLT